jgi:hypothetical protein
MSFLKKLSNKFTAPNANITLKLDQYGIQAGDNLTGTLTLNAKENIAATEVRCEVTCTEQARVTKQIYDSALKRNVSREVTETATLFTAKPVLSGPTNVTAGETREFPVKINIPMAARHTYQSINNRVTWTIKGVIAIDGRPDVTTNPAEIQVAPPTAQPITREREVIREVVMIACKYCGGLMTQTETSCPKCGAKRTA